MVALLWGGEKRGWRKTQPAASASSGPGPEGGRERERREGQEGVGRRVECRLTVVREAQTNKQLGLTQQSRETEMEGEIEIDSGLETGTVYRYVEVKNVLFEFITRQNSMVDDMCWQSLAPILHNNNINNCY